MGSGQSTTCGNHGKGRHTSASHPANRDNEGDHEVSSTTTDGSTIAQRLKSRKRHFKRRYWGKATRDKKTQQSFRQQRQTKIGAEDKQNLIKQNSTEIGETTILQETTAEVIPCAQKFRRSRLKNRDAEFSVENSILNTRSNMSREEPKIQKDINLIDRNSSRRKRKSDIDRKGSLSKKLKKMPRSPTPPKSPHRSIKSILKKSNQKKSEAEETADIESVHGSMKTFGFGRIINWVSQLRSSPSITENKVAFNLPEYSHRNVTITSRNRRAMDSFNGRLIPQSTIDKLAEPKNNSKKNVTKKSKK